MRLARKLRPPPQSPERSERCSEGHIGPRYVPRSDEGAIESLRPEVLRVLQGVGSRLADGGGDLDAPAELAVGDLQAEGVEDLSLDRPWRLLQAQC